MSSGTDGHGEGTAGSDRCELRLAGRVLKPLHESLAALPDFMDVTTLDLRGNQLTAVPDCIGNLAGLVRLTTLPDTIGNLTGLTWLHLDYNQLTELPDTIGNLTRLNELHLDGNRLTALPDTAGNLTNLIDLYVDDDVFEALPESLRDLPGYL
jgi:hypothetical protein